MVKVKGREGHWTPCCLLGLDGQSPPLFLCGTLDHIILPTHDVALLLVNIVKHQVWFWFCYCCGFLHHTLSFGSSRETPLKLVCWRVFVKFLLHPQLSIFPVHLPKREGLSQCSSHLLLLAWSRGESPGLCLAWPRMIRVLGIRLP